MDVVFEASPKVEADDWRQAQLAMERENMMEYTAAATIKVFEEGNAQRPIHIVPSSALVKEAMKTSSVDPGAFIKKKQATYLKVIKQGLSALGDEDALFSLGFDDVMDTLDSCHVLYA